MSTVGIVVEDAVQYVKIQAEVPRKEQGPFTKVMMVNGPDVLL